MNSRLVQPFTGHQAQKTSTRNGRAKHQRGGSANNPIRLSHLVWRFDPEQCQPRCQHGGNPMNKHKPGFGQLSIILDNEA
jgi:hypothetical protein